MNFEEEEQDAAGDLVLNLQSVTNELPSGLDRADVTQHWDSVELPAELAANTRDDDQTKHCNQQEKRERACFSPLLDFKGSS